MATTESAQDQSAEDVLEGLNERLDSKSGTQGETGGPVEPWWKSLTKPFVQKDNQQGGKGNGGWVVPLSVGAAVLVGGAALVALLWKGPSAPPPVSSLVKELPRSVLFGFWQGGERADKLDWWIGRIHRVEGNTFYLKWQGTPQRDGQGTGIGDGRGIVQPDGRLVIDLTEETRRSTGAQMPSLTGLLGGGAPAVQAMRLEGLVVARGERTYMTGTYLERGGKFYPFSTWVFGPEMPKGWKNPGRE